MKTQITNFEWFIFLPEMFFFGIGISGMKSMAVTSAWKHSEGLAQVQRHLQAHEG